MIEALITWFYNYVSYYFPDIVVFLLAGYVFIRCRSFGYVYSGVVVLFLIFLSNLGGYALPQLDTAIIIFLGTVAGGWRYLAQARSYRGGFGFPFFSWRAPRLSFVGSWFESFEAFQTKRRFRKTYTEELAREEARKTARGSSSNDSGKTSGSREKNRPRPSQRQSKGSSHKKKEQPRKKTGQSSKQEKRRESFKRSRPDPVKPRGSLEILGLSQGYTQDELKERYRKLASQYHPDKYQNMSDTVKQEMNAEFVAVKQAYEKLKK